MSKLKSLPMPLAKLKSHTPSVSFDETSNLLLSDTKVAVMYLEEILAVGDMDLFKSAVKDVATARVGNMTKLANKTHLARQSLYRSFSASGNPKLDTLSKVLSASGLRLSVSAFK